MKYSLFTYESINKALGIEKIEVVKDEITGFHHLIDEYGNKFNCQDDIDFSKPMAFYVPDGYLDKAILINHLVIFTNELNVEEGDVRHINLRISPSSASGSKAVNEILANLNSLLKGKEDDLREISEKYSTYKDRIYLLQNASEVWDGKIKRLITSNFYKVQEVRLNHKLTFGKYKGLTLNQVILSTKNFDLIHWATTNIEWFYFDYDAIYFEGLSIKQIIQKYGDKKTNARFSQVLEFQEVKETIHAYWMSIEQDNYEANEERQIQENWLKDIRNDWMDNADDYWNID
jgi:hypothetical protein